MFFWKSKPTRTYLDYAAATPVLPAVLSAMAPYQREQFANASAIHGEGRAAREAVETARLQVARTLGVRPYDVLFTASGSESNNLALYGRLRALFEEGNKTYTDVEIITTRLEHPSVLEVVADLEQQGVVVHYAPVDEGGVIDLAALKQLLTPRTALITFAYANSEIGVVQPVKKITRLVRAYNTERQTAITTHLDASQAPWWLLCQMPTLGVDLMTLDAGKCGGPKGVGILVVRGDTTLRGVTLGGGQERSLRAGTENTAGIVGAAMALSLAQRDWKVRAAQVAIERNKLEVALLALPGVVQNGSTESRLANNLNISIPGIDTEFTAIVLDAAGIAVSTKSACSGAGSGESAVVRAISGDSARAAATLRFSLGPDTRLSDTTISHIVATLEKHCQKMQALNKT